MDRYWQLELKNYKLNNAENWGLFSSPEKAQAFAENWAKLHKPTWIIEWDYSEAPQDLNNPEDIGWIDGHIKGKYTFFQIKDYKLSEVLDREFDDDEFYSYMDDCIVWNEYEAT